MSMGTVSIVAGGTRGDVQPYVALGVGLKAAGYVVRVLTSANFEAMVTEAGLTFHSTGESVEVLLQRADWQKTIERGNFLAILARMRSEMQQRAGDNARTLPPLLTGSDVILTGMSGLAGGFAIADMLQIPIVQTYVFPFTPTSAFSSPLTPRLPFGGALNRFSFHAMQQIFWQTQKSGDVATRSILGLGPSSFWGPFRSLERRRVPALYGYSPLILPRPSDWPDQHHVTGYWFLEATGTWTPPADLVTFLGSGEPPVYIGFGSMGSRKPQEAGQIALEALARSGQRGILASGWGGLTLSNVPDSVYLVSSVPHSWLFPQMRAVVHHGGAGTTAAGLRAGVPNVIVPFMGDQPFWGRRVAALGAGPAPIPRKQLSAERLAAAINEAVSSSTIQQHAQAIGQQVRDEDGVGAAVAVIERFLNRAIGEHST